MPQPEPAADEAYLALDLALVLGAARQAGIDVEGQGPGVGPVGLVDLAPRPGASGDAGLEVVDAQHRRDAASAAQGLVVGLVPAELVHAAAPDEHGLAAVRQDHDEGVQLLRATADVQVGELAPAHLGLGGRGRFDAAEGPQPRSGVVRPHEAQDRAVRAGVAVFGYQPVVQGVDVGGPLRGALGVGPAGVDPVGDGLSQRVGLARLVTPSVGLVRGASVVTDAAPGYAEGLGSPDGGLPAGFQDQQ